MNQTRREVTNNYYLSQSVIFLWIGFVGAISFMEAWLKFRAPGVTLPIGLSIGSLVFNALNKVEWVFTLLIALDLLLLSKNRMRLILALFSVVLVILVIQTFWLLPALDARIALYVEGAEVQRSPLHVYYIAVELIKVAALLIAGIRILTYREETVFHQ